MLGINQLEDMIALAKRIMKIFHSLSAMHLHLLFQKIFSNAVFHWIDDGNLDEMNIARNMKKGGELVTEFGGEGCADTVHSCL